MSQNLDLQTDALTRAGLAGAMAHLRAGDCLVVWKLDRLGRGLRDLIDFIEELNRRGVAFRTLDGAVQIDTSTAQGRFFFHVMAALAEMERDLIRERTRSGLAAARARGNVGGRPRKLGRRELQAARAMLEDGKATVPEVAASFKVSAPTLYRALLRPKPSKTGAPPSARFRAAAQPWSKTDGNGRSMREGGSGRPHTRKTLPTPQAPRKMASPSWLAIGPRRGLTAPLSCMTAIT